MKEQIGVQMFTVRNYIGDAGQLYDTLLKIKKIGYDCIQMSTLSFQSVQDYKKMLDDTGLYTCCGGISYIQAIKNPRPYIEEAQTLGCRDLVFGDVIWENLRTSAEGFFVFAKMLNQVGAILGKEGMKVHYHFHAMDFASFSNGKAGLDIMLEETDPETVFFMPDTHWIQAGGREPSQFLKKLSGRMSQVHFKDYAIEPKVSGTEVVNKIFAEVGEGNLDWPAIVEACRCNNTEYYVVEQDLTRRDPFESISISYQNMKRMGL